MTSELAPGSITTADLYRELTIMTVKLAVIETQGQQGERQRADHEARIRGLERRWWVALGFASAVGSASGIITALIVASGHG